MDSFARGGKGRRRWQTCSCSTKAGTASNGRIFMSGLFGQCMRAGHVTINNAMCTNPFAAIVLRINARRTQPQFKLIRGNRSFAGRANDGAVIAFEVAQPDVQAAEPISEFAASVEMADKRRAFGKHSQAWPRASAMSAVHSVSD